jgi:hypothetical protein
MDCEQRTVVRGHHNGGVHHSPPYWWTKLFELYFSAYIVQGKQLV